MCSLLVLTFGNPVSASREPSAGLKKRCETLPVSIASPYGTMSMPKGHSAFEFLVAPKVRPKGQNKIERGLWLEPRAFAR